MHERQNNLLKVMEYGKAYAASDLMNQQVSVATSKRDVTLLLKQDYISSVGKNKGTRYFLSIKGLLNTPYDPQLYCSESIDARGGKRNYFLGLFEKLPASLLTKEEIKELNHASGIYRKKLNVSGVIAHKELERFVIELSWKSSRIEGNTYTLLDTERLLREGKEATGHTKEEAIMILNHKKAFYFIMKNLESWHKPKLRDVENLHRQLTADLNVNLGLRKGMVGVLGSSYIPLSIPSQIREEMESLLEAVEMAKDPYSKALLILIGISYIQGFEDGNKRTARLCANAILLANKCAPLSYRSVEEDLYKTSMLVFYEKQSLVPMKKIFLEQYLFSCENYLISSCL